MLAAVLACGAVGVSRAELRARFGGAGAGAGAGAAAVDAVVDALALEGEVFENAARRVCPL